MSGLLSARNLRKMDLSGVNTHLLPHLTLFKPNQTGVKRLCSKNVCLCLYYFKDINKSCKKQNWSTLLRLCCFYYEDIVFKI